MALKTQVSKWGSSLAVRIPKAIAEEWGVEEGSAIEMTRNGRGLVLSKPKYTLEELLEGMKEADLPPEVDWGPPRGKEIW